MDCVSDELELFLRFNSPDCDAIVNPQSSILYFAFDQSFHGVLTRVHPVQFRQVLGELRVPYLSPHSARHADDTFHFVASSQ